MQAKALKIAASKSVAMAKTLDWQDKWYGVPLHEMKEVWETRRVWASNHQGQELYPRAIWSPFSPLPPDSEACLDRFYGALTTVMKNSKDWTREQFYTELFKDDPTAADLDPSTYHPTVEKTRFDELPSQADDEEQVEEAPEEQQAPVADVDVEMQEAAANEGAVGDENVAGQDFQADTRPMDVDEDAEGEPDPDLAAVKPEAGEAKEAESDSDASDGPDNDSKSETGKSAKSGKVDDSGDSDGSTGSSGSSDESGEGSSDSDDHDVVKTEKGKGKAKGKDFIDFLTQY